VALKRTLAALTLPLLLIAGCGGTDDEDTGGGEPGVPSPTDPGAGDGGGGEGGDEDAGGDGDERVIAQIAETFEPYSDGAAAVTYDEEMVPEGARVELTIASGGDGDEDEPGTEFDLEVYGLHGDHDFGAHMHTDPCGADPDDSGPHYQDRKDPEQPSTDPRYANDDNEVWLDLRTDSRGDGDSDTDVDWTPRPEEMRSLVIHAEHTKTAHGEAGTAGDRLACADVELK